MFGPGTVRKWFFAIGGLLAVACWLADAKFARSGEKPLKVVVCAGQSNMVGLRSKAEELPAELQKVQKGNLYFDGTTWVDLAPGVTAKVGFGPEISLAYR